MGPVKRIVNTSHLLFSRKQSSILTAASVITIASLLSAVFGFVRDRMLIARFFSNVAELDAYWVAFRIPELTFQILVVGALSASFIPVFSKYAKKSSQEAYQISNVILNLILLFYILVSVIIFIFAEQLNSAITSTNFTHDQVILAAKLSRIMILAQFFFAISNFLTSVIQANHRFLIPALAPLAYNAGIIAGIIFLTPMYGIFAPAYGVVLGALLHLLMQLPLAYQLGFRYKPSLRLTHPGVREMIRLMPPRTLAIAINQLELFISVYFATALSAGSLTIINIAQRLMSAPIRIFSVPIAQASLPFLSRDIADGQIKQFQQTLLHSLHQILFLTLPAAALLIILRIPLVRIVYGASEFPWSATLLTGKVVALLCISLFAQGTIHILVRAFYALHNTKIPLAGSLISVCLNVILSYIGVFILNLGVLGLALAMSTASIIHFTFLITLLMRRLGLKIWQQLLIEPFKMLFASLLMAISLWAPMRFLDQYVFDTTRTLPLIGLTLTVSAIGAFAYLAIARLINIIELQTFIRLIRQMGNWQQVLRDTKEVIEPTSQSQEMKPL